VTFNHAKIEPTVAGSTYTWELRDLQPISHEPAGPPVTNLAPRIAITYTAPDGAKTACKTFSDWADLSRWMAQFTAPQSAPSPELAAKAKELTAGASTEIDKIRAVGRYVQGVRYISIQTDLARGGGYLPHAAAEVFAKSYGDCKDKANLMLAMLKTVGVDAYLVSIYSGDATYVRKEWASPHQFNHCIIAVKVSDATTAPTTVDVPGLGKLLIFDPTDTFTPVGDLPDYEQNSYALVIAPEYGQLVRMPVVPPDANRLERTTEVALAPDGSMVAKISERSVGQAASGERRLFGELSRPDYEKRIGRWITGSVNGAKLSKVSPADDAAQNKFSLDVEFTSSSYAQIMQGRLFVFKPALVERVESLVLTEASRSQPVVLDSQAFAETARIKLPAGFEVDETPDPVKLDTPFGTYTTAYEVKDGELVFSRRLTLQAATVPADQYQAVRSFFEKMRAADQAPVVLVRK
jgi:hypothetical protein